MATDVLRSAYTSDCYIYSDSQETIHTEWNACDDDTLPLTFPTAFGSVNWLPKDIVPVLGEKRGTQKWIAGNNDTFIDCVGSAIDKSYLLSGITQAQKTNPLGVPPCCQLALQTLSQIKLSGSASVQVFVAPSIGGSLNISGTYSQGNPYWWTAGGIRNLGGSIGFDNPFRFVSTGIVPLGNSSPAQIRLNWLSTGGIRLFGSVNALPRFYYSGGGSPKPYWFCPNCATVDFGNDRKYPLNG
jgi:hypothetical protein